MLVKKKFETFIILCLVLLLSLLILNSKEKSLVLNETNKLRPSINELKDELKTVVSSSKPKEVVFDCDCGEELK